ncbi:hypothetical protein TNIN_177251 [Trichonephila inaurata madagascariensis]|uniref:Uncharacterized protein n=1 Tax=Trichonephila inaurata madagascariensis TaxID=2747483 RepID=A0A8X7CNN5_9ARAC|nr:hypothetical protein TNIN_177251 [Trichonephila inaurata madagascariensis]
MFKNCRKEDLRIVALELGNLNLTIDRRQEREDPGEWEDRKKRKKGYEKGLELARLHVGVNSNNERTGGVFNSLDALVKSVRI